MKHKALIAASIALGIIAGLVVGIRSPRVEHNLHAQAVAYARAHGMELSLAALHVELFPPALVVKGVVLARAGESDPWLELHEGRVAVQPWPSPAGALVIDHLELDGLRVSHAIDLSEPSAIELTLPVDIRELLVWNARAQVDWGEGSVSVGGVDLTLQPDPAGGRHIALEVAQGRLDGGPLPVRFETRLQAHLDGSLDRPQALTLMHSKVFLNRVSFAAHGSVQLGPEAQRRESEDGASAAPPLHLVLEGGADLAALSPMLPQLPALAGRADLRVELRGRSVVPWALPLVRVAGEVRDTWVAGRNLGDVKLEAVVEGTQIMLESVQVQQDALGKLTGSGTIDLADLTTAFSARLHRLSLPTLMARAGLDDVWVRAAVSGDVQGTGALEPLRINGRVDLDVDGFQVLGDSYRHPDAVEMLGIPQAKVRGSASVTPRGVEILGVEVSRNDTLLTAEGLLSFNPELGLDLKVSGPQVSLADVGPIASIPFAGRGSLFAALEGPYADLSISGTPDLDGLEIAGVALGDAKATVIFEDLVLHVDRATVQRRTGSVRGQGSIDFNQAQPEVNGNFEFKNLPIDDVLTQVGVVPQRASRVGGVISGQMQVSGPLARPVGVIDSTSPGLVVDRVALGALELRVELGGDHMARVVAKGSPGGGTVALAMGLEPRASGWRLEGDADIKGVRLDAVTPLLGHLPVSGRLSSKVRWEGEPTQLSGTVSGQIEELEAWNVAFGAVRLHGEARDGRLDVRATAPVHGLSARGAIELRSAFDIDAEAAINNADVLRLLRAELPGVALKATAALKVRGSLAHPNELLAEILVSEAPLTVQGYFLQLAKPAQLTYRGGLLQTQDVSFQGTNLGLSLAGRVLGQASPADLDVTVVGRGDLAIVQPWLSSLESASGPLMVRARLTGNLDAPLLDGSGRVEGARLIVKGVAQELTDLQARFEFSGRNVEVLDGFANLGGGKLNFSGGVVLPTQESRTQIRLYGEIKNAGLRLNRQLTLATSGNLSLIGPLGDLLLKGNMQLHSLRYVKNLELDIESFFPRRDAPLSVPNFAPGHRVAVDVHVEAPGNIRLDAGAVQGELKASLDFRGTTDSLGLNGTLTPIWARARYRDIEFEYVRGDITFTEEFRLFAKYDLTARGRGCDIDMTLNIVGDSRGEYAIELSGVDESGPVHQQDPWSCITYGVRLSEFGGETAVSQAMGAERTTMQDALGSGLDLLWGVSGLDAKMRQILPYVDEVRITLGRSGKRGKNRRVAPRLVLAKEVGENLSLKYNGALDQTDDHVLSLEYQVSDVATVQGSWVSISDVPVGDFGLDLRLQWQFD